MRSIFAQKKNQNEDEITSLYFNFANFSKE